MTTIGKDTDLVDATVDTVNWMQHGWETCTASAFNVVIYTYNQGAAYSDDAGDTFHVMDANGLCSAYGKTLIGDQVVTFIPRINQFAWVILTTDQNIVLALASPREVQESRGTAWVTWLIPREISRTAEACSIAQRSPWETTSSTSPSISAASRSQSASRSTSF